MRPSVTTSVQMLTSLWANTIIRRVKIKTMSWKLSSFTSRSVFQQLTDCKFYSSATDSINFVVFFRSLTGSDLVSQKPEGLHYVAWRVTKFIVTICWLKKRQWQVKERRQIQGMTPKKFYAIHLVSSVLPLTAPTHFLPDHSGNDTEFKLEITNLQVTSNSIAL